MAYTTINKSSEHFNTKLYTGNESTNAITGVGHQPDFVWMKNRDSAYYHGLYDSVRGTGTSKSLYSNANEAEGTNTGNLNLASFDSDGFTLGATSSTNIINKSSQNHVAWNWKANGAGSANTDGSISSTVSANTTSGFSIVSYTGTGADDTVGHGLGVAPKMIITKATGTTNNWGTYHESLGNNDAVFLNLTNGTNDYAGYWNTTTPTSSVFSVGVSPDTNSSATMIAYCFAEKQGFSKFGSYTGNGNANGTFVYTGFKPAFVMVKRTDSADGWFLLDDKRDIDNAANHWLMADSSSAEQTSPIFFDFLSNGFKNRGTGGGNNASGGSYIYMAFAENPFVTSSGVPATAR